MNSLPLSRSGTDKCWVKLREQINHTKGDRAERLTNTPQTWLAEFQGQSIFWNSMILLKIKTQVIKLWQNYLLELHSGLKGCQLPIRSIERNTSRVIGTWMHLYYWKPLPTLTIRDSQQALGQVCLCSPVTHSLPWRCLVANRAMIVTFQSLVAAQRKKCGLCLLMITAHEQMLKSHAHWCWGPECNPIRIDILPICSLLNLSI